jgi:acetyl-CoA carboxylase carboxyltransferase component
VEEGVLALEGLGAILSALSDAKGQIPLLSAVMGPCPGGLALAAAKSDFIFFCEGVSGMYMNSPSVTAAMSADAINPSDIGTPESHRKQTGLASFVLPDEESCLLQIRDLLDYIPVVSGDSLVFTRDEVMDDDPNRTSETLNMLAEEIDVNGLPIRDVFREIADRQTFLEISEGYGTDMVTAFARLDGITVGLIGNAAPRLTEAGAKKTSRFVRFCTAFMIPLITFTNAEGFEIGSEIEKSCILEAASDLVSAFSESDIPRIGIIAGKAIGTAYLVMNSRMLGADMVFAWPTAQIAIMSADTAANILYHKDIAESEDPIAARALKVEAYDSEISNPEVAAGYGQVDELILPSVTRPRIISALDILLCAYPLVEKE